MQTNTYVDPKMAKISVAAWADRWLAAQAAHVKPTTLTRTKCILHGDVLPRWGAVLLADITHMEVKAWVASLGQGRQPATVRKIFGVLSRLMGVAVKDGRLGRNSCTGVNLPRPRPARRRYLNHADVAALAAAAGRAPNGGRAAAGERAAFVQYETVFYVLAYCGLRWGELAALKVSSVDLLRRRLEIAESVVEDDGRLVWGVPKTHERNRIFRRSTFDRAAHEVGQAGLVPKDLRHTAASLAISAGANVKAVQRMLGHASAAMTLDTYADLFDDDLDAVANRLHLAAATARDVVADQLRTKPQADAVLVELQDAAGQ